MSQENWRYEYLSDEIREYRKRVEEAKEQLKQAHVEADACQWQYDKAKTILDMLEIAYKVNSTNHKEETEVKTK